MINQRNCSGKPCSYGFWMRRSVSLQMVQYLNLQRTHRGALWASGAAQAAQVVRIILRFVVSIGLAAALTRLEKPEFFNTQNAARRERSTDAPPPTHNDPQNRIVVKLTHITRHEHVPQPRIVRSVRRPRHARIIIALDDDLLLLHNFLLDHFSRRRDGRPAAPSA